MRERERVACIPGGVAAHRAKRRFVFRMRREAHSCGSSFTPPAGGAPPHDAGGRGALESGRLRPPRPPAGAARASVAQPQRGGGGGAPAARSREAGEPEGRGQEPSGARRRPKGERERARSGPEGERRGDGTSPAATRATRARAGPGRSPARSEAAGGREPPERRASPAPIGGAREPEGNPNGERPAEPRRGGGPTAAAEPGPTGGSRPGGGRNEASIPKMPRASEAAQGQRPRVAPPIRRGPGPGVASSERGRRPPPRRRAARLPRAVISCANAFYAVGGWSGLRHSTPPRCSLIIDHFRA